MIDADKRIKVGHSYDLPDRLRQIQYGMTGGGGPNDRRGYWRQSRTD